MNKLKLLLFATLRQRAGTKMLEIEIPDGMRVRELKSRLAREYPALSQSMGSVLISINREYAADDDIIPANGEVGLFPPVSGG